MKTIDEKSKAIAEFMGAEIDITCAHYDQCDVDPTKGATNPGYRRYDAMEYHSSFDWLIPVVRKLKDIKIKSKNGLFDKPTDNLNCQMLYEEIEECLLDLHVLATFNAAYAMIYWYTKKQQV